MRIRRYFWRFLAHLKKHHSQTPLPLKYFNPQAVKRILVVSCTALGDTLLSTPAIKAVRKLFPAAHISWLIKPQFFPLFQTNPHVNDFLFYPGRFRKLFSLWPEFKKIDLFLSFHDSDEGPEILAFLAEIPFVLRVGLKDERYIPFLSTRVPYRKKVHTIEQRLDVLRTLLRSSEKNFDTRLVLPVREDSLLFARRLLGKGGLRIGFQCKASNPYCEWPLKNFATLARELLSRFPQSSIFLLGAKKDRKALSLLEAPRVINLAGKIPVKHLGGVIRELDLLVTIDTGPMHVAFAVGTPTVCLFVPSEVVHTGPYQDLSLHRVIRKERPCSPCKRKYCKRPWCMELISVEEVFSACEEALS